MERERSARGHDCAIQPILGTGSLADRETHRAMNFEEHAAKPLLRAAGIATPTGALAVSAQAAANIASSLGPCVLKAQIPSGKRGKAGGIKLVAHAREVEAAAKAMLGMTILGHTVERLLVEEQVPVAHEMYAAVVNDAVSKSPLLLFSARGGMDIEEIAARHTGDLLRLPIDIRHGLDAGRLDEALSPALACDRNALIDVLKKLYAVYASNDAELLEINPLAVAKHGGLVALDCKFSMDDSAIPRHEILAKSGSADGVTALEARAKAVALKFIELEGNVGVLANGAGLTMTTMDAVRHYGGVPANFMEIGGDSYTKAKPALELVLANPRVKCLLVNFCGAFARTDVMTEGVINAWLELKPSIPIFFTIHGTGEDEAIAMVKERLAMAPFDLMDDAVQAAVGAANGGQA
jgi:succinyl-CoA synthetase beta subunit